MFAARFLLRAQQENKPINKPINPTKPTFGEMKPVNHVYAKIYQFVSYKNENNFCFKTILLQTCSKNGQVNQQASADRPVSSLLGLIIVIIVLIRTKQVCRHLLVD